jgi:hypothetical protein
LKLLDPLGERVKEKITSPKGDERLRDARFFHLRVCNREQCLAGDNVHVFLIKIEERSSEGELQVKWDGDVPLQRRYQEAHLAVGDIEPDMDFDFISIVKDKWLQLHPLLFPIDLEIVFREKASFIASLQARSEGSCSPVLKIKVSWDGKWCDEDHEMQDHLQISVIE